MLVDIKKLKHLGDLPLPAYATIYSAGLDLIAAIPAEEVIELATMQRILVPTGISIALPSHLEAQIRPRSGLAIKHGITVVNAPGTIDADYRGEIFVALINLGLESFQITRGMRIAQMIIAQYEKINWNISDTLENTTRDSGGFGSTGI